MQGLGRHEGIGGGGGGGGYARCLGKNRHVDFEVLLDYKIACVR